MARSTYDVREFYEGNGTLNEYTFDFKIEEKSQLLVVETDASGVETNRVRGTDTSVYLSDVTFDAIEGGGTVTLQANLTADYFLYLILANDAPTQPFEFRNNGAFKLLEFEKALDFLGGAVQRLAYIANRSTRLDEPTADADFDTVLPATLPGMGDRALVTNEDGDGWAVGPTIADISSAQAYALAAQTAQLAAEAAQVSAETAQTGAETAQTGAETAQTAAEAAQALAEATIVTTSHAVADGQSATDLTGTTIDGADYDSRAWEYEIVRGTTVVSNGVVAMQYVNGTWRAVDRGWAGNEPHGITWSVNQSGTEGTLQAAASSGPGGGTIILRQRFIELNAPETLGDYTTDDLIEGATNLYFTTTRAQSAVNPSGLSAATVASGDLVMVADVDDGNALKRVTAQDIADLSAGTTDHGALSGLSDDDHPQYLLIDGSRAMTAAVPFDPGGDADINLISVSVTGTPTVFWDESEDAFSSNKNIILTNTVSWTIGTSSSSLTLTPSTVAFATNRLIPAAPITISETFTTSVIFTGGFLEISSDINLTATGFVTQLAHGIYFTPTYTVSGSLFASSVVSAEHTINFNVGQFGTVAMFSSFATYNARGGMSPSLSTFTDRTSIVANTSNYTVTNYTTTICGPTIQADASRTATITNFTGMSFEPILNAASGATVTITNCIGMSFDSPTVSGAGTKVVTTLAYLSLSNGTLASNLYGVSSTILTNGGSNYFLYHTGTAHSLCGVDNVHFIFGSGEDFRVYFNGTNAILDPDSVSTGRLFVGPTANKNMALNDIEINGALNHDGSTVGLYNTTPVAQYSTTGTTTGFTAGTGTGVNDDSTFTGNTGATAYTVGDVVRALKLIGAIAS